MAIDFSKIKMNVPDWVKQVLDEWDKVPKNHFELEIGEALKKVADTKGKLSDEDLKGYYAEWSAFFFHDLKNRESIWGTHFGPAMSFGDNHSPDITMLDAEIVGYWETRAKSANSPIMRARYADLVWDLKYNVTNQRPSHEFALIAIDCYIAATEKRLFKMEMEGVGWLRRALHLALIFKDESRIKGTIAALFNFYDAVFKPRLVGVWIVPFDLLYEHQRFLTPDQQKRIVDDLEKMLALTSGGGKPEEFDPHATQAAAERLATHYRRKQDPDSVKRVFRTYAEAFKKTATQANPLLAMVWLQPVIERMQDENLKTEAEDLQLLFEGKRKNVDADLKTVSVETKIEEKEIKSLLETLIHPKDFQQTLKNFAIYFIPKADAARSLLQKLMQDAPFLSLANVIVIKKDGTPTAKIGSMDEDKEGRLHQQLNQTIGFYQPFLSITVDEIRKIFAPKVEQLVEFLSFSPLFKDDPETVLKQGLDAYLQQDYMKAIHILVPQIEKTLRRLLPMIGVPSLKPVRDTGIMDAKGLNNILAEQKVREVLSEDIWRYLSVVYVDKRGLNLRNDLAHGLMPEAMFNKGVADRIFHTILVLGLARESDKAQPAGSK
jgi:hypothetical protein